jgi:hypothetical protein
METVKPIVPKPSVPMLFPLASAVAAECSVVKPAHADDAA